jgi:hypothetical protein
MPEMRQQEANHPILSLRRAQRRKRRKQFVKRQRVCIRGRFLRLHPTHLRLPLIAAVAFLA